MTMGFEGPMTAESDASSLAPLSRGTVGSSPMVGSKVRGHTEHERRSMLG